MKKEILILQKQLNKPENSPRMAYRRDSVIYPLVCCVNNIVACYISENYKPIPVLINRGNVFIKENAWPEYERYYEMVKRYFVLLESVCQEDRCSSSDLT